MAKLYASKVIEIALAEVGYLEKKSNSNLDSKTANVGSGNFTKYARDLDNIPNFYNGKKNGYAWCDIFVDWCFVQAFGVDKAKELLCQPNKSLGAGCFYSMQYYKNNKQFGGSPKIGAQIFFSKGAHTGIVYDYDKTYVYTVEGNTSSASGVVANGGAVEKKKYKLNSSYIDGYGYPNYDDEPKEETKAEPKKNQIAVDGVWGKETTRKAQEVFGTPIDGIVSNQYEAYAKKNRGLLSSTFDWNVVPQREGSVLIKAIQKKLNIKQDGYIGPLTIKAMQSWLETPVDGVVDNPSLMVKAFQKWLNAQ